VFASVRKKGRKLLDLASVLNRKIKPAFSKFGIWGVGWHTFRHTAGSMLAEMGEHQLTIGDYLRHSNLNVTNKYLQARPKPSGWHRTSWSQRSCRADRCRAQKPH